MPGPAARMGDMTAHGGTIAFGFPTVLIAGQPAARLTDMHVCPMVTPAPVPVPHVGGPVTGPGCPTVLIGNLPAVTMGDMAVCVGPPDVIALGAPTVLIGMAGAGSASGGGAGAPGAGGAQASAAAAQFDNKESVTKEEHWVEFKFVDKAGLPVSGVPYEFKAPDGKVSKGVLRLDGKVRRDALPEEGSSSVVLMYLSDAKWSVDKADPGDVVSLSAAVEGFESGTPATFRVYRRDLSGPDALVTEIRAKVDGDKVEAEWTYEVRVEEEVVVPADGAAVDTTAGRYSAPEYYFEVLVGSCVARSGMLYAVDFIEIEVVDEKGRPLSGEEYVLLAANGEVRQGKLDGGGCAREENLPAGTCGLRLPGLPELEAEE